MKRQTKEKILELLKISAKTTGEIFEAYVSLYTEHYKDLRYRLHTGDWSGDYRHHLRNKNTIKSNYSHRDNNFYSVLSHLKKDGLVAKEKSEKNSSWTITQEGLKVLTSLRAKKLFSPSLAKEKYRAEKENDSKLKIIIFDIPEKEKHKRIWLRAALLALDFRMLQKSVWAGKSKIPEKFLVDLNKRKMLGYVRILEVTKTGNIKEIQ